jgi:hypothetical protein
VTRLDFDVVLVGSAGAGHWGDLLLALLAEQKSCAMVVDVLDIDPGPEALTVTRDLGRGSREILSLRGAAVLSIAESAAPLLYVSRYRRQAVRLASSAPGIGSAGDPLAAVSGAWIPARPRVKTANLTARTRGSASHRMQALLGINAGIDRENDRSHMITADAATCAGHLLRFLRHHGFITGAMPAPAASTSPEIETASRTSQRLPDDRESSASSIWTPHLRSPRPLQGEVRGMARRPRPLQPGDEPSQQRRPARLARGPRSLGQTVPQQSRGPRPI